MSFYSDYNSTIILKDKLYLDIKQFETQFKDFSDTVINVMSKIDKLDSEINIRKKIKLLKSNYNTEITLINEINEYLKNNEQLCYRKIYSNLENENKNILNKISNNISKL